MTYQELLDLQAALESAMLTSAGTLEVQIGDRRIKYQTRQDMSYALAEVNRSICRYNRRRSGAVSPGTVTPVFTHYD